MDTPFVQRVLAAVAIVAITVILLLAAWIAVDILLLIFISILFALCLHGLAAILQRYTRTQNTKVALMQVVFGLLLALALLIFLFGAQVETQVKDFQKTLPESREELRTQLDRYPWGKQLIKYAPTGEQLNEAFTGGKGNLFSRVTGVVSLSIAFVTELLLVTVLGLFFTFDPGSYLDNFLRLFPISYRPRMASILSETGKTLQKWLLTRFFAMSVIGVLTTLALYLMGMPMALTLGLIAGLLTLVPTFGSVVSVIPAVLVAVSKGPMYPLYIILLYAFLQQFEDYAITPFVVKKTIHMPPGLILGSQVIFGVLFGSMGVVVGAPLAVALVVLIRRLYVEDVLGDEVPTGDKPQYLTHN